jgi:hypothetical protein
MGKSALRKIIDLSNLSEEDVLKLNVNLAKAETSDSHRGFASAMKNAGLAGTSLRIQDSLEARQPEVKSELVETESTEEVEETIEEPIAEEAAKAAEPVEEVVQEPEEVVEPVAEEVEKATSEAKDQPVITAELLQQFVNQSVKAAIAPLHSELEAAKAEATALEQKLSAKDAELATAKQSQETLDGLGRLLGKTESSSEKKMTEFPNVNKHTSIHSDKVEGRLAEFMQTRDASNVQYRYTSKGNPIPTYPTNDVDRFTAEIRNDPKAFRSYMDELTAYGKKSGMFRGTRMVSQGEMRAATTSADIPGGFLEVLSSIMRVSARPGLVFWQFPATIHRYDRAEGEVIDIPRAAYPAIATDSTQRLLSGGGTYVPIDNSNQRVRTGLVKMILNEYGRGRSEAPPISIPTFVEAFSMIPLMRILERDLFYDYYNWEDLIIREQWRRTSQTLYNNSDAVVTTAAGVNAGGTMTRRFLSAVYTRLANARVVPLPDGNYGLVTNPTALMQLKNDMDKFWLVPEPSAVRELTNMMLSDYPAGEDIRLEGYQGLYEGFHIWSTNSFANGAAGTEGVANETNGDSGTSTVRTSYAFGGFASGRGIGGAGVQILFDEKTDFGRVDRAIWQSYEAHGPLDVDATGYGDVSDVPQETRVYKIQTFDVATT